MVRSGQTETAPEPSEAFNQQCVEAVRRWEAGGLPFDDALACLDDLGQQARREQHMANQARAEHALGYIQHYRGNLNTSIRHYERARSLYLRVGNRNYAATVDLNLGENYRFKGDFQRARTLYHAAYETARELGSLRVQTIAAVNEGLVLMTIGEHEAASDALMQGLALTTRWEEHLESLPGILCEIHHGMSIIHLNAEDYEAAWGDALKALEAAQQSGQPLQLGYANRTLGEVITAMNDVPADGFSSDPDLYFRASVEAFREIKADAEMARTMFAQARSLALRGRRTTAARKLQQAMIIFTRLGMVDDAARAAEAQLAVI